MLILSSSQLPLRGRLSIVALLLIGTGLSIAGFFFTRNAYHRRVEVQFYADARDRSESVVQGFQRGFDDVAVLRTYFESSSDVTRVDFDEFTVPILARHPYIQAFQWLPEVTPRNRAALEEVARSTYPGFRFFKRDAGGQDVPMPRGATFHAVYYLAPYKGNEVILGFSTDLPRLPLAVSTARQEALARALRTGAMTASGRIRLIQETGNQFGMLVMVPIKAGEGHPKGVAQGVFRMGDLVHKSMAFLEPRGLALKLFDASATEQEALLHEEPSPLRAVGPDRKDGLSLVRHFELAGRRWRMEMAPVGGHYALGAVWQAWAVLLTGLAFSGLFSRFVWNLLASEAEIWTQVETRTQELALETESHRRDAQALRESEARFRLLIDVMGEGMWVLNAEGRTTFVNRRMAEMLGQAPDDMVGRSLVDFIAAEDVGAARRNMAERREGQGAQHDFRFRRRDGGDLWAIVTGTPVLDDDGKVVSVLGIITDITDRRKHEQAQLQSQKLESLGVLAGGIAHDFNNLLTAILGNINLAQMTMDEASPAWPFLGNMEQTVQRATNLTRQMLAYSGKGRFMVGPLDLNQSVKEMSHLLAVSLSKKVSLRFQFQEGLPVLVAEATQIQQVVMNLVTNASEAIGEAEGTVTVRTGLQSFDAEALEGAFPDQLIEPGDFLTLEVMDTGQGMTPEVQARIFEPFFTTKFTGRGLGLSAMQGIVRGHRGGISVHSEVGKGTVFKVILPAGAGELLDASEPEPLDTWQGSGTILVVDDEEEVRTVASALLESMGFDVVMAQDGLEAIERFRANGVVFRAVLMDLTMPHMGGLEAFRELRRLDPGCRVVLTSGYNEQEARQGFKGEGLAGFVQKPFQRIELLRGMRQALEA